MYCKNCGKEIKEGTKFCPQCGNPAQINFNPNTVESNRPKRVKKRKLWKIFVAVVIILILALGGIYLYFVKNQESVYLVQEAYSYLIDDVLENYISGEADSDTAVSVEFEHGFIKLDGDMGDGEEYAIISGLNESGEVVWTYETEKYGVAQLERIFEIGVRENRYYFIEDGTVVVLNLSDGSVLWKNGDYGSFGTDFAFGKDGTLYLCGYLRPDFFAVDKDGKTLRRIQNFDQDYFWATKIEYQNNQVIVTLDHSPSGDQSNSKCVVNLNDYTYSFVEEGVSEQKNNTNNSETDKGTDAGLESENSSTENIDMTHIRDVYASSSLSEYNMTHFPERVCDGDLSEAWVEGADGQGIGENLVLLFDDVYVVNGFYINAGYQRNDDLYYKNSRPKEICVTFSDGTSEKFVLEDVMSSQNIQLKTPAETDSITITINSVYPGNKYEDTVISEIRLY